MKTWINHIKIKKVRPHLLASYYTYKKKISFITFYPLAPTALAVVFFIIFNNKNFAKPPNTLC